VERDDAPYKKDERKTEHQEAIVESEVYETSNHSY
jgi:hypothetical protein